MGGFGSGRYGGMPTAEATASYVIALSSFKTALRSGQRLVGRFAFDDGDFPVSIEIDCLNAAYGSVELVQQTRDDHAGDRMIRDRIQLTWTEPTYGGRRMVDRVSKNRPSNNEALPTGGWHFWSRQAYRLGYACQREDPFSRLQRRAAKLSIELGGDGSEQLA